MPRYFKVIGFLLVTLLGVYGCTKGPTPSPASSTDTAKIQKLEEDYKAAIATRDQLRQQLATAEDQKTKTQKELEQTRTNLQNEVKARTAERDALQVQYETFRKNLKELLGSADSAVGALNLPAPKPPTDQGAQK
jgi:chromosome segregation ATPase